MNTGKPEVTILGGGPAGLAIGHYARQAGLEFTIYEGQDRVGGNCVTLEHAGFRFDSGAHRFHDKNPDATREVQQLLGADLRKIEVPSQIWHAGQLFDFPLAPFNLLKKLGPWHFARAVGSLLRGRLATNDPGPSFRDFALRSYGADVASRFLLNYSEKLWGAPCEALSPVICGTRLKGLGLKSLIIEALFGQRARTRHLDGAFYYPRQGFGAIAERMADSCGRENIRLGARVTRLRHDGKQIQAVEINGRERVRVDELASSLPLGLTLRLLDPAPPGAVLELASQLRYRNVVLVALFIDKDRITNNGSVYFPDRSFPFTRVYEPKNRSDEMSPPGQTSLVAEIPCQPGDALWSADDSALTALVSEQLARIQWFRPEQIIGSAIHRLPHAYPILELDYEARVAPIVSYLSRFQNLQLAGRNGCFVYSHLHDMLQSARMVVDGYLQTRLIPFPAISRRAREPLARAA
jgi:protoporphyrinogen oxidase